MKEKDANLLLVDGGDKNADEKKNKKPKKMNKEKKKDKEGKDTCSLFTE